MLLKSEIFIKAKWSMIHWNEANKKEEERERDSGWSERDLSRHSFYRNSATLFFASSSCSFVVAARSEGIQQPWNFRFKKALSRKSGEKNYLDNSAHYLCVSHTQYVDEISKIVFKKIVKTSTALIKFWVDFFPFLLKQIKCLRHAYINKVASCSM